METEPLSRKKTVSMNDMSKMEKKPLGSIKEENDVDMRIGEM